MKSSSIAFLLWTTTSATTVYKTEFTRLTKEGCVACQTSGFGWSDALSKCGGFSNSASQCQGKWDEGLQMNADAQEGQGGQEVPEEEIEWADTSTTSQFHNIISSGNIDAFVSLLKLEPESAKVRSADGRGPLFWAFEYNMLDMQSLLIQHGADADAKDAHGQSPAVLLKKQVKRVVKKKVENIRSVEEEEEEEEALTGYATAGIATPSTPSTSSPIKTREEYRALFAQLGGDCNACVDAGFGYDKSTGSCGGFANSGC
jgi:hypothetical protein